MRRKITRPLLAAALLLTTTSCVKDLEEMGFSSTISYTGTVVEKSTQQPIEKLDVKITDGSNVYAKTKTGTDGSFTLANVNVDNLNEKCYLLLDGSDLQLPSRKGKLRGFGSSSYDYKEIYLYDKTSAELLPSVTLTRVAHISGGSAECSGEASLNESTTAITDRGFVWSTSQDPTLERGDSHASAGSGAGNFTVSLTGLSNTTVYYVRAYATNMFGTIYSAEQWRMMSEYMSLPTFNYNGHTYKVAPAPATQMTWDNANDYCNNYSVDGITGWRLPTKDELVQMYSAGMLSYPYLIYWSSTYYGNIYGLDYYYYIYRGSLNYDAASRECYARPIRQEN